MARREKRGAASELQVACPTSRQPRYTPGFVTRPLRVLWVALCFCPCAGFVSPCCMSPAQAALTPQLPQSIPLIATRVVFGNVRSAFEADVCILCHLLGYLSSVMHSARRWQISPLIPSHHPPWSLSSGLCKSHWQIDFPACYSTSVQEYHKQRHFQRALRQQQENRVSKQLHWTLNDT